ncbi:hypothetical protein BS78_07G122900 [Paspalum vaginatum]|nr:hypothetical protein BS78_07G122900 [Paspalum vaginatum]
MSGAPTNTGGLSCTMPGLGVPETRRDYKADPKTHAQQGYFPAQKSTGTVHQVPTTTGTRGSYQQPYNHVQAAAKSQGRNKDAKARGTSSH